MNREIQMECAQLQDQKEKENLFCAYAKQAKLGQVANSCTTRKRMNANTPNKVEKLHKPSIFEFLGKFSKIF